jgi:hypothetical protein
MQTHVLALNALSVKPEFNAVGTSLAAA